MAESKSTFRRKPAASKKFEEKQAKLQKQNFPDLDLADVWTRQKSKGFTTIPRTLPLICSLADLLSGKGKPVGMTYMELWCRANDTGYISLSKQAEIAFASGFSGERATSTWKDRMRRLENIGLILIASGHAGDVSYAQLLNPYKVMMDHQKASTAGFDNIRYRTLYERALDIGAKDME